MGCKITGSGVISEFRSEFPFRRSPLVHALVLPTFMYATEILGGDFKNFRWKVFKKGMKIRMICHIKMHSSTIYHVKLCSLTTYHVTVNSSITYHILLVKVGELSMELYALKLTTSFQHRLVRLPSSSVAIQSNLIFSSRC